MNAVSIHITGIVQGVGFRPFVFGLAEKFDLFGWVRNTSAGVDIEIEGDPEKIRLFIDSLWEQTPPLAHIDDIQVTPISPSGMDNFQIIHSQSVEGDFIPISPDVSICNDCQRELFDPQDRRYRYPFINCTNCGPRLTIIQDIPYDRPLTTMAEFKMCTDCEREYYDPRNRRFHAQPTACPECGPQIWLLKTDQINIHLNGENALQEARKLLADGKILAIKGLGGFHLACDATNSKAVSTLRRRKLRVDKAFAVMLNSLREVEMNCFLGAAAKKLLTSPEKPIVILERRPDSEICFEVAPGQNTLGIMLPYTPLHQLLLEPDSWFPCALVMTSGNLSEEPISITNDDAIVKLAILADAFLLHNRDIETRCDDSVYRIFLNKNYPLRRSRGYAPFPINLQWKSSQLLATGADLKNTFCLVKSSYAFMSHHIGDLENYETFRAFNDSITHYERLFRVTPELVVHDLHPDYFSTRYAEDRAELDRIPVLGVQHHHAHIASCMAEYQSPANDPVIGIAFDGTGYGLDGAIWGGEFFTADYTSFNRILHLNYIRLPGGDKAILEPWRVALAWMHEAGIELREDLAPVIWGKELFQTSSDSLSIVEVIKYQIDSGLNAPFTSSMGRLFDAVASILGIRQSVNYEAQAAIELEAITTANEFRTYPYDINDKTVDFAPAIREIVNEFRKDISPEIISTRFHNTVAMLVHECCQKIRTNTGINRVVLSGGVWQNMSLLSRAYNMLKNDKFEVLYHHFVPTNDGGIALGQAAIALQSIVDGKINY